MVDDFLHLGVASSDAQHCVTLRRDFGNCPMRVTLLDDDRTVLDVYARDVESDGMLFICRDMLKVGHRLEIHLLVPGGSMEIVTGKVTRHKRVDSSSFGIAVAFDRPVNPRCLLVDSGLPA